MMVESKKLLENVQTYVTDAQHIAVAMKGDALLRDNMHAYVSSQAAIDILLDVQMILDGEKIPSLEEIKAGMNQAEKAQVVTGVSDAQ